MYSPPLVQQPSIKKEDQMLSSATDSIDQITVLRHHGSTECNVVVTVRGRQIVLKCRDFKQAAKWAGIEAKSYKIPNEFSVEWATANNPRQRALSEEYGRE
jgi:hypothetical protein